MAHRGDVHQLDVLADEFWQEVQKRVEWTRQAVSGPVTVGTKKPTRQEMMRQFLASSPEERAQQGQTSDLRGVRSVLFDLLGDHALNILPHIGPPMVAPEEELPPEAGVPPGGLPQ